MATYAANALRLSVAPSAGSPQHCCYAISAHRRRLRARNSTAGRSRRGNHSAARDDALAPRALVTPTAHPEYLQSVCALPRPANEILHQEAKQWAFTSWSAIYRALLSDFDTRYHLGYTMSGLRHETETVQIEFNGGTTTKTDLVVCANGIPQPRTGCCSEGRAPVRKLYRLAGHDARKCRQRIDIRTPERCAHLLDKRPKSYAHLSDTRTQPCTAAGPTMAEVRGYRNVCEGPDLDELLTDRSGSRSDVSVPPGQVQYRFIDELEQAAPRMLAPAAAEVILRTAHPYIQPIFDVKIPRMTLGPIALIGDARSSPVPTQQPELPRPPKMRGHLHRRLRSTIPISLTHCSNGRSRSSSWVAASSMERRKWATGASRQRLDRR